MFFNEYMWMDIIGYHIKIHVRLLYFLFKNKVMILSSIQFSKMQV